MKLTETEIEIIELIRNIRRAYPNGYENLTNYLDALIEMETTRGW